MLDRYDLSTFFFSNHIKNVHKCRVTLIMLCSYFIWTEVQTYFMSMIQISYIRYPTLIEKQIISNLPTFVKMIIQTYQTIKDFDLHFPTNVASFVCIFPLYTLLYFPFNLLFFSSFFFFFFMWDKQLQNRQGFNYSWGSWRCFLSLKQWRERWMNG